MIYDEAVKYIHSIPRFVRPLGNADLGRLLEKMGDPHKKLRFVHVAGTNGKGSVCAMTAEILKRAGYRTGLFTSPFIEVFNERIQINNELIPDDALARYVTDAATLKDGLAVSEFAFITAVAMRYFADNSCDIVVLETGMGGRLDATNVIPSPDVAAITEIGLDHTEYLGETVEEIAAEKCGIIKKGCEVVSAPNEAVTGIIKNAANAVGASLTVCDTAKKTADGFTYRSESYELALSGSYQAENAAVVLEVINALRRKGFSVTDNNVRDGFRNVFWKARYQFASDNIVIDGCHNPDGIRALKKTLAEDGRDVTLVLAMMRDKDYESCIRTIAGAARLVVATEVPMERSLSAYEIKEVADSTGVGCIAEPDIKEAINAAVKAAGDGGLVCICGSLYLAGAALREIRLP